MNTYLKTVVRFFSIFSILVLGAASAWGNENDQEQAVITVSASGTVHLPPDKALVSLAVETAGESLEKVQADNRTRMNRVFESLKEFGIKKEWIQTTSLNVTPHYPPPPRRQPGQTVIPEVPKIIGYTVRNSLRVEVHKLDRVGQVVDGALKAGANRFSSITWAVENEQPARLKALQMAAQKAREKAEALAQTLNVKLARLLTVTEQGAQIFPPRRALAAPRMSMAMDESASVPVSPGQLKIQANVTLVFEISPL